MSSSKFKMTRFTAFALFFALFFCAPILAQDEGEAGSDLKVTFEPNSLMLQVGEEVEVNVQVRNAAGELEPLQFFLFARGEGRGARRSVTVDPRRSEPTGEATVKVKAHRPGSYTLNARTFGGTARLQASIPIEIAYPPLDRITFVDPHEKLYVGSTASYSTKVFDKAELERDEVMVQLKSSDPKVASLDAYGNLTAHKSGSLSLIATADGLTERLNIRINPNPVTQVEVSSSVSEARTGDVVRFEATALNRRGDVVEDAMIEYSFVAKPADNLAPAASGQIENDGRFVAETPGLYTIIASSGPHMARKTISVSPRNVAKQVEIVGYGPVTKVRTSDLWVWEGVDGRDYAVTGTWNADGEAYFWDVTDPANITLIDTVTVDARTVNDVKVSEDGRVAIISREGASNRRNGIVILDVTNPRDVKIHSSYDDELTGGVHNLFIYKNHVYAVNNGRRYDIINIDDPKNPYRVSRFELDTPGHSIHDVWIEDGIAYSSNWSDGLQLVDVGSADGGGPFKKYEEVPMPEITSPFFAGGSPSNPVKFASYEYPSGWNHAAFPYYSEDTKRFYVLAGDEARYRPNPFGTTKRDRIPDPMAGWIHFVEFTDIKNPKEVARYQVPEGGSHNLWVEDDILYAAFYQGGIRIVDISGELMGDLYRQGREIATFMPTNADGFTPNATYVWGPQPYKGHIYLADMNSGLWAIRLVDNQ